jgi:hypothetical protein
MLNKNYTPKISNPPNKNSLPRLVGGGWVECHIPQNGIHQNNDHQIHIFSNLLKLYFCHIFDTS